MTSSIQWERTPWYRLMLGHKPWRYWQVLAGVGGDFSCWVYADTPSPETRPAWMPDLDGKYKCDGCGAVLHHNGHCDCTWNRRLVPIDEGENPALENHTPGVDIPRLPIGTSVEKVGGYPFPGHVVSAFHTLEGNERFVVEATGEAYRGMLHIFNGGQLRAVTAEEDGR